ncbi:MAG: hypothetical protein ACTIDP_08435 [Lactococcus cremoris]|uniref:hypothetical protein n=1 Tax=Lactococcus lactis subsp. cremoris TaxID=1359 RepID=UPI000238CDE0|nr:hypothetical protein [Lactococcus cremoris]EQC85539.1 hypothetical protein LLT7_04315 [Lactococcus cremoris subsp. cremoris TIFN7]MDU1524836.1 hypothetical protein [Lactococcus lactis]AEU41195.1 hypothetical protein llh_10095 [Lactococcus cremoris subsp. cremoris A76]MCT0499214.1 hypothetical protein [Lactococcus cremoris]MDU2184394.1 hypothetical protein [Lactococcus lactis]
MKKTYFMRYFIRSLPLFMSAVLMELLSLLFQFLIFFMNKLALCTKISSFIDLVNQGIIYLNIGSSFFKNISIVLITLAGLIMTRELYFRLRYDSLKNLALSIRGTTKLRRYLHHIESFKASEDKTSKADMVISDYNKAIRKIVMDVNNEELLLYTKLPKEHQAQKMLKEVVSEIKEEVSNAYPEYLISGFERHGNSLWLKGTRK